MLWQAFTRSLNVGAEAASSTAGSSASVQAASMSRSAERSMQRRWFASVADGPSATAAAGSGSFPRKRTTPNGWPSSMSAFAADLEAN